MTAVIDPHEPDENRMVEDLIDAHIISITVDEQTGQPKLHIRLLGWSLLFGVSEFRLITEVEGFTPDMALVDKGSRLDRDSTANFQDLENQYNTTDPIVIIWHEALRKNLL